MTAIDGGRNSAGWRILVAGTGGQGVLTVARVLCEGFVERGHDVVSGQLHGMAQRGGSVQSSVIIDGGISPVIASGRADFVLGFEPVETARAIPFMAAHTVVFMNTAPISPFVLAQRTVKKEDDASYPDIAELVSAVTAASPRTLALDATQCAVDVGSIKTLNMVMLGCLLGSGMLPCGADAFWSMVSEKMPPALRDANAEAFSKGVVFAGGLKEAGAAS